MSDISVPERRLCESLAPLLRAAAVGEPLTTGSSEGELLSSLEFFLPEVLREAHQEWRHEGLDGIYPKMFRKTAEREMELVGLALFITDQTLTPLHVRVQLSPAYDRVAWIDLRLGERVDDGCRREPYGNSKAMGTMLHVAKRLETIDWHYHVGYGERDA